MNRTTNSSNPGTTPAPVKRAAGGGASGGDGQDTTNVDLTKTAVIVADLVELCRHEIAALRAAVDESDGDRESVRDDHVDRGDLDERVADLHVRLAVMFWNSPSDRDDVIDALVRARAHPLAWQLLLSRAIGDDEPELLDTALRAAREALRGRHLAEALRDLAEAWLYRRGQPERAVELAASGLAVLGTGDDSEDSGESDDGRTGLGRAALLAELHYLHRVALAQAGSWRDLADTLTQAAVAEDADLAVIGEAIHVIGDRLGDPEGAVILIQRVLTQFLGPTASDPHAAVHRYRVLLAAHELAPVLDDDSTLDPAVLYQHQLGALVDTADTAAEEAAVRYSLTSYLRYRGQVAVAAELLAPLLAAEPADGTESADWGTRLARLTAAQLAARTGDWSQLAGVLRELAG
ncbi:MAG: hypothetical protein AAGC55_10065, partial [Myxococcota bacterium]